MKREADHIVAECLKGGNGYWRHWSEHFATYFGNDRFLCLTAYWHHCPQCHKTTPEMLGDLMRCVCGKVSPGSLRRVRIKLPSDEALRMAKEAFGDSRWFRRLGTVLRNLAGTHPAEFVEEETTIELDWPEPEKS